MAHADITLKSICRLLGFTPQAYHKQINQIQKEIYSKIKL